MPLSELQSAAEEATASLSRSSLASVAGVSCTVVCGQVTHSKNIADAGFWQNSQTVFHVLKTAMAGFTLESLHGKTVIFEGKTLRINSVSDNGLRFALTCEALDKGR